MNMSADPRRKDGTEFTDVDPIVSETLDSALEQLHLDDLEENDSPNTGREPNALKAVKSYSTSFSSVPPSHMFPHPQMIGMGFIPFSQMMPVPHQNGFFPPPDFNTTGLQMGTNGPDGIIFNNSNDASVFNSVNTIQPPAAGFSTNPIVEKSSVPNSTQEQLWYASNSQTQDIMEPVKNSSAIEDSTFLEDNFPQKAPGGAIRRQTFHAISTNELIRNSTSAIGEPDSDVTRIPGTTRNSIVIQPETLPSNIIQQGHTPRTQSTSLENDENSQLFNVSKFPNKKEDVSKNAETKKILKDEETVTSPSYAAAYPYGGSLLHPNPVLPGNSPSGSQPAYGIPSPFHGTYGFASPFQFSPVMGNPNSQIPQTHSPHPHNTMPMQILGDASSSTVGPNSQVNEKNGSPHSELQQGLLPPQVIHQQGGTPPPWMYGNHPFGLTAPPQAHPHMMHPHSAHAMNNNSNQGNRRGNSQNNGNRGGKSGFNNQKGKHNKGSHYYHNGGYNDKHRKSEDASRYADANLHDFIGSIYLLCKDQHGCRFLQRQLDVLGSEAADLIFNETRNFTVELMTDSFGNYLIQKLLERVNVEQRVILTKIAAPHFVYIASNPHGTRALQKLVECISTDEEADIVVQSLRGSIVQLSKDLNGNHIVQKCLQRLQPKDLQFIFDAACENCVDIATHRHGCCVLQRCLDHGSFEQRDTLCKKLMTHVEVLTLDPFGNYVVQYIITKESETNQFRFTHEVVNTLTPRLSELSLHKFGSNVIEKILRTPAVSNDVISNFLDEKRDDEIQALLNDCYGNYVLQTMLDVSKDKNEKNYEKLLELVRPLLIGTIRNTPHGRRIASILQLDQPSHI